MSQGSLFHIRRSSNDRSSFVSQSFVVRQPIVRRSSNDRSSFVGHRLISDIKTIINRLFNIKSVDYE